jgi:hypothetical protein
LSGLRLEFSPSRGLALLIVALHAAAALSILMVLPGVAGATLAAALVALGLSAAWSRALHRSSGSVRGIDLNGSEIALNLASGARIVAEVAERRYVTRFVVALPLRRPRRTILVTRDMLAPDSFRSLRLWALWGKLPGVAAKQLPA